MVISWCVSLGTEVSAFLFAPWECPGLPTGHVVGPRTKTASVSSQDLNINLPLSLSPDQPLCLMCSLPFRAVEKKRWKRKVLCVFAVAPCSLLHIIFISRGAKAWDLETAQRQEVCGPFPPDLFILPSCVTFPSIHKPELNSLPCMLNSYHYIMCTARKLRDGVFSEHMLWIFRLFSFVLLGQISYNDCISDVLCSWLTSCVSSYQ